MAAQHRRHLALMLSVVFALGSCASSKDPSSELSTSIGSEAQSTHSSSSPGSVPQPNATTSATETTSPPTATRSAPTTSPAPESTTRIGTASVSASELKAAIGTVFMVGVPATGASKSELGILTKHKVSNVFLRGRSTKGTTATKEVTSKIRKALTPAIGNRRVVIATDQEGGYVQVLQGPGFSKIPTALAQGKLSDTKLKSKATKWGRQLAQAGIDLNLAPVGDTVKNAATAPANAPIGYFSRQYAYKPATIARKTKAFSQGMRAAGVGVTIKHFPGLGYVRHNTDTTLGVKDNTTTTKSASLLPFKDSIARGEHWIMLSSAIYTKIDSKNLAAFSSKITKDLLRNKLGFEGIILSDDLCSAKAVSRYSYGTRAKKFFNAGGTMFLCVDAEKSAHVMDSLYASAQKDPQLAARIIAAAKVVNAHVGR